MVLTEDERNKILKRYLKAIVAEKVKLDEDEAKINIKIVEDVLARMVAAMKRVDPLFKELYQRPEYTGSYYENLRVKSADEFDINLVLRLPFNRREVKITLCPIDPIYVTYQLAEEPNKLLQGHQKKRPPFDKIIQKDFFDSDGYLQQHNVARWIQSVISKAIDSGTFQLPPEVEVMKNSRGGPAFTYYITTTGGTKIDLDLVPVIDAAPYSHPEGMNPGHRFKSLSELTKKDWFLVPKPFSSPITGSNWTSFPTRYWRMSFPGAEKKLLSDTGCLTMVIKLFKLLRDCNEYWRSPIASYFIKTFLLLEYEKYDPEDWEEINLGTRYMEMLRKFEGALEDGRIPYYFNKDGNLLSSVASGTTFNIFHRIDNIIRNITKDPSTIKSHYSISPNTLESKSVEDNVAQQVQQESGPGIWAVAGTLAAGLLAAWLFKK